MEILTVELSFRLGYAIIRITGRMMRRQTVNRGPVSRFFLQIIFSRICPNSFFSRRETRTCVIPRIAAVSTWVFSRK